MEEHPTVGVEEEFLLVDSDTGEPVAANQAVAEEAEARGVQLQLELTSCQVETTSRVVATSDELGTELTRLRRTVADAAGYVATLVNPICRSPLAEAVALRETALLDQLRGGPNTVMDLEFQAEARFRSADTDAIGVLSNIGPFFRQQASPRRLLARLPPAG